MPYDPIRPRSPWADPLAPIDGADQVRVIVLAGYGLNCEEETAAGFRMLGARADIVHVGDLVEAGARAFANANIVVFPGGCSFGGAALIGRPRVVCSQEILVAHRGATPRHLMSPCL